MLIYQLTF